MERAAGSSSGVFGSGQLKSATPFADKPCLLQNHHITNYHKLASLLICGMKVDMLTLMITTNSVELDLESLPHDSSAAIC